MGSNGVDANLVRSRYRLTKQRSAILRALADGAHLTAETLLERVRVELPAVSLGTIYRTVDILHEIGLVQIFVHNGMAARYEAALDRHHHLVCDVCHDITNVNVPALEPLAEALAARYRYAGVNAALTLSGRCRNCSPIVPANGRPDAANGRTELPAFALEGTSTNGE